MKEGDILKFYFRYPYKSFSFCDQQRVRLKIKSPTQRLRCCKDGHGIALYDFMVLFIVVSLVYMKHNNGTELAAVTVLCLVCMELSSGEAVRC
jgi:hypothetical protein